ncbi:MAG TPA: CBS domain-containing protein [Gemmatimonadaceae bacterium]
MKAKDIMTADPCLCSPQDSLRDVAQKMRDHDCGSVPVVEHGHVVGIVTDRDLTIRALADGLSPDTKVEDVITRDICCCTPDDDVRAVERVMADQQVRRVPVVDASGCCVGIVSQADLARAALSGGRVSEHEVALTVERISEPSSSLR